MKLFKRNKRAEETLERAQRILRGADEEVRAAGLVEDDRTKGG